MDEGPIQVLFSIFGRGKGLSDDDIVLLKRIIKSMPLPDMVVIGPCEPQDVFVRRLLKRGHHRVTGIRHGVEPLSSDYSASEEVEDLARNLVNRSVMVQKIVQEEIDGRIPTWGLEDTSEWDQVVSSFSGNGEFSRLR